MTDAAMFPLEAVFRVSPGAILSEIDGSLVMMRAGTGEFCGLEGTAEAIVRALEVPTTFADLLETLSQHFEGQRAEIAADTAAFLADMVARDLLVRVD